MHPPHQSQARETFKRVCQDARKAWTHTQLLSLTRDERVSRAQAALRQAGARELAAFMTECAGPLLVRLDSELWGGAGRLAEPLMEALLEHLIAERPQGGMVEPEAIKEVALHWIETGRLPGEQALGEPSQARLISDFVVGDVAAASGRAGLDEPMLRLALLAPLVSVMETLAVLSRVDGSLLQVLRAGAPAQGREGPVCDKEMAGAAPEGEGGHA